MSYEVNEFLLGDANEALDLYVQYMEYDGDDDIDNEDLRWQFIDAALELLERLTDRCVADEVTY